MMVYFQFQQQEEDQKMQWHEMRQKVVENGTKAEFIGHCLATMW
jgi:hypothetical protein